MPFLAFGGKAAPMRPLKRRILHLRDELEKFSPYNALTRDLTNCGSGSDA
jgi:hypothetical protein